MPTRPRFSLSAWSLVAAACVAGCSSTPSAQPVEVTYRFEGVRAGGGLDDWKAVREVLAERSQTPIREDRRRRASVSGIELSDISATVTLPSFAAADEVQQEIAAMAASDGTPVDFALVNAAVNYRGNAVAAGVEVFVAGFAPRGFRVRLFPTEQGDPMTVTAGRNGLWNARLAVSPADGWLYGLSEDPDGKVRTRYFRINVANQKQEDVAPDEFVRRFPAAGARQPVPSAATKEK